MRMALRHSSRPKYRFRRSLPTGWITYLMFWLSRRRMAKSSYYLLKVNSTIRRTPFLYSYIWFIRTFMSMGSTVDCCMIVNLRI